MEQQQYPYGRKDLSSAIGEFQEMNCHLSKLIPPDSAKKNIKKPNWLHRLFRQNRQPLSIHDKLKQRMYQLSAGERRRRNIRRLLSRLRF